MTKIRINYSNEEAPDYTVDLNPWNGREMGRDYFDDAIRRLIEDLEATDDSFNYSICGDSLVLVNREDYSENERCSYLVTVCKVMMRGYAKPC